MVEETQRRADGTVKLRLRTADGYPLEAVAMRHGDRRTVCLSSQSGCALACRFCATGAMGFGRNLTAGEILEQLLVLARLLREEQGARVHNVVMMGMGEPFQNTRRCSPPAAPSTTPTASASAPGRSPSPRPAGCPGSTAWPASRCSSSSPCRCTRPTTPFGRELMPVTRRYPVAELMAACRRYREATRRRVFVEYLLLEGVNDGLDLARELGRLLRPAGRGAFHVNLIAYNPTGSGYTGSSPARVKAFGEVLDRQGLSHSYRLSHGRDIDAACGQLAASGLPARRARAAR